MDTRSFVLEYDIFHEEQKILIFHPKTNTNKRYELKYQSYSLCPHFIKFMNCTLKIMWQKINQWIQGQYRWRVSFNSGTNPMSKATTFSAISKHFERIGGRSKIRTQTALKPWVIRSPFGGWGLSLAGIHNDSNSFSALSGRTGASPSNLLRDLSVGGSVSRNPSACKYILDNIRLNEIQLPICT